MIFSEYTDLAARYCICVIHKFWIFIAQRRPLVVATACGIVLPVKYVANLELNDCTHLITKAIRIVLELLARLLNN
jgi:hypothetical protein